MSKSDSIIEVSDQAITVETNNDKIELVVTETVAQIEFGESGPQGAVGPTGAQGPQGTAGSQGAAGAQGATGAAGSVGPAGPKGDTASVFYVHTQATASDIWTINHNLGGNPTAVVHDSAGTQCEGNFSYPSINQMTITFSAAFSGVAYII